MAKGCWSVSPEDQSAKKLNKFRFRSLGLGYKLIFLTITQNILMDSENKIQCPFFKLFHDFPFYLSFV